MLSSTRIVDATQAYANTGTTRQSSSNHSNEGSTGHTSSAHLGTVNSRSMQRHNASHVVYPDPFTSPLLYHPRTQVFDIRERSQDAHDANTYEHNSYVHNNAQNDMQRQHGLLVRQHSISTSSHTGAHTIRTQN